MKFKKYFIQKTIIITSVFIFSVTSIYSQITPEKRNKNKTNYKYGDIIELKINEATPIDDSLSLKLTYFTHKRPFIGGSTKATATVIFSKGTISKDLNLSIHGVSGKSQSEDGLSDSERYDSLVYKEYEFQLKEFNYDNFIKIIIIKHNR